MDAEYKMLEKMQKRGVYAQINTMFICPKCASNDTDIRTIMGVLVHFCKTCRSWVRV